MCSRRLTRAFAIVPFIPFLAAAVLAGELKLALKPGARFAFHVEKETPFSGPRGGSGDSIALDTVVEVKEVSGRGRATLEVRYDAIRWQATGRRTFEFDSREAPENDQGPLAPALRQLAGTTVTVELDRRGRPGKVTGFPRPGPRESAGPRGPRARAPEGRPGRAERGARLRAPGLEAMLLRQDLEAIFAPGIRGQDLEPGAVYPLAGGPRRAPGERPGRRQGRPGGRPAGGPGELEGPGRGLAAMGPPLVLKYSGEKDGLHSFAVAVPVGRPGPGGEREREVREVGTAAYRAADGVLEKLSYELEVPRGNSSLKRRVSIQRVEKGEIKKATGGESAGAGDRASAEAATEL